MDNIITYSAFKGRYLVANAQESQYVQAELTQLITDWQEDFLRQLLGATVYQDFKTWYEAGHTEIDNPQFYLLLNGGNYGENSYCPSVKEPLTAFVYFYYKRANATQSVSSGEANTDSQNAVHAESGDKASVAWNRMVTIVKQEIEYLVSVGLESWHNYYQSHLCWPNRHRNIIDIVHPVNPRFN